MPVTKLWFMWQNVNISTQQATYYESYLTLRLINFVA